MKISDQSQKFFFYSKEGLKIIKNQDSFDSL